MNSFPGRVLRNLMVADICSGTPNRSGFLAGRVIGVVEGEGGMFGGINLSEKGFVFQDQSGSTFLIAENLPKIGDVLEVEYDQGKVKSFKLLASCEDFFVVPGNSDRSPNYKKMLIDQKLRNNFFKRAEIISAIREFFRNKGFLETDTPCLVKVPGMEPYLDVFKTRFFSELSTEKKVEEDMYLITSPEYAMKKLLVGGMEKIFQITKSFRNKESFSDRHNPEFTILEWYRAYASYLEIMEDTEELVKYIWQKFGHQNNGEKAGLLNYKGKEVDLTEKWEKLSVLESFERFANIDAQTFFDLDSFRKVIKKRGYAISELATFDDCFYTIFLNEIEPNLGLQRPVILYDYPVSMAALSKKCANDGRFAERFEVYIAGLELCNAFTELNDPLEQEKRLSEERNQREVMGKDLYEVDHTFIDALKFGMPPSGGNALGVDRLIMLILGESDIRNVLYFPQRDL